MPCEIEPMDFKRDTVSIAAGEAPFPNLPLDLMQSQEKAAQEITRLFVDHPLDLDQAGASRRNRATPVGLPRSVPTAAGEMLRRRGDASTNHPDSVITTFSLAFERVERLRPDAAELLRFCAFLHPDALPEELLLDGALSFDPASQGIAHDPYVLDTALAVLHKYSLIKRNSTTKTVSVHRLVQDVLKKSMDEAQQRAGPKLVVRTLSRKFPNGEPASWPDCLRYLPHARVGIRLLEAWQMRFAEAVRLLNSVGYYLYKRGAYTEAQGRYKQALELLAEDEEHLLTTHILSNLGVSIFTWLTTHRLSCISEEHYVSGNSLLEPTHPQIAQNLNDLAGVYHHQGNLVEAEPLYQQALAIQEQTLEGEDPATVRTLGNLALLKYSLKKYAEAEELNKRVLAAREKYPDAHLDRGQSLLNLAYVYLQQQRYTEAEAFFQHALTIYEKAYGSEHPQTMMHRMAWVCSTRPRNGMTMLSRSSESLPIYTEAYGPEHPSLSVF